MGTLFGAINPGSQLEATLLPKGHWAKTGDILGLSQLQGAECIYGVAREDATKQPACQGWGTTRPHGNSRALGGAT